jgi:hypothetical protein
MGFEMKKSFAELKLELEEACTFLRSFTLGRHGFTQRDGLAGIERVNTHCDRLNDLFVTGPNAKETAKIVARGRSCVLAAQTRLAYLRDK